MNDPVSIRDYEQTKSGKTFFVLMLILVPLLIAGLVVSLVVLLNRPDAKEVAWAREIADQYLNGYADENVDVRRSLSTKEHAATLRDERLWDGPVNLAIESNTLSPDGSQLSFKGRMDYRLSGASRSFAMLMEKQEGRWRVASFVPGAYRSGEPPRKWKSPAPTVWVTPTPPIWVSPTPKIGPGPPKALPPTGWPPTP